MMGKPDAQGSMIQLTSLEQLVPEDHFLRKLDKVLDLGFVPQFLQKAYPSNVGNPSVDPLLAVRMIILAYLFDLSDVRLCEEVHFHAGYRWFCRLDFHKPVPHRTTLVKFRTRCRKHGLWEELFHRIVAQCGDVGLLSGRHLMADSTQVTANASIKSLAEIQSELTETADRLCSDEQQPGKPDKDDDHHHTDFHGKRYSNATHRSSTDPDAQFYRKSRGKEAKLSFKVHNLADTKSRVIVGTSATQVAGDEARDGAQALLLLKQCSQKHGINPKTLCADTAYGSAETITGLTVSGIAPHIPLLAGKPPELPVWKTKTRRLDWQRKRRKKLETAIALQTAWRLSTSRGYQISRKLRHRIEHLFGEAKQSHGLRKARSRGLEKMNEQATLTAIVQNLKRLVKYLDKRPTPIAAKAASCRMRLEFTFHSVFRSLPTLKSLGSRAIADTSPILLGKPLLQMT